MAKPAPLKTRIADFVKEIEPDVARRDEAAIKAKWMTLMGEWSERTDSTRKLYTNKVRSAVREHYSEEDAAWLTGPSMISHDQEVLTALRTDYNSRMALTHHDLTHIPHWPLLLDHATQLLDSTDPFQIAAGLLLVTGRRVHEVWLTGILEPVPLHESQIGGVEKYWALFKGQAKTRAAEGTRFDTPYRIPVLAPATLVRRAWKRLRDSEMGTSLLGADGDEFQGRGIPSRMASTTVEQYQRFWPEHTKVRPKDLRALYAEISYQKFPNNRMSKSAWFSSVLGHKSSDIITSLSYMDFWIENEAAARAAYAEAQAALLADAAERGEEWAQRANAKAAMRDPAHTDDDED